MQWIALQWPPEASSVPCPAEVATTTAPGREPRRAPDETLAWWALRFTPRVARADEALLLEVSGSLRLWGGLRALMRRIEAENPAPPLLWQAQSRVGLVALAELRLRAAGLALPPPAALPEALPLEALSAARPHLALLARLGCRTWGQAHALPRAGLVRRCGPALRAALDVAFGLAGESYPWLAVPERFDQALDLQTHVDNAPALLWAAARLLTALQHWLRARQLGVLALELSWALDRRRLDGRPLPPGQALAIRTAEPAQAMEHLRRLLAERLARVQLMAPAVRLRLRATETAPWQATSHSLLPEERRAGEPLHVFVERVSARLGPQQVLAAEPLADHRPERRQRWRPAQQAPAAAAAAPGWVDALAPTWLFPEPLPLAEQGGRPFYHGPLHLLAGPRRIEAGWWPDDGHDRSVESLERGSIPPTAGPQAAAHGLPVQAGTARRGADSGGSAACKASAASAAAERGGPVSPPPGRPKAVRAPSGGSDPCAAGERGGSVSPPPGRPKAARAPSEGSDSCAAGERGGSVSPPPGRPKAARAPSGGSDLCAAGERGGSVSPPPGRPKAARAPSGLRAAAHDLPVQAGTPRRGADSGGFAACKASAASAAAERGGPVARDYYVARNPASELLWVFRERPTAQHPDAAPRWFLHGLYA